MKALKELGQHFLNSTSLANSIATLGDLTEGDRVWEIGSGKGILTDALLQYAIRLRAFELDQRLYAYLDDRYHDRVKLEFGDVMRANWDELVAIDGAPIKLIANIPYQITTPLLALLEKYNNSFSRIILMVQKEVAQRLCATAGSKSYAPLTIRLRLKFNISLAFKVDRRMFDPPPKVDSAVIIMLPRTNVPVINNYETFNRILNAAFAHRRKTLGNNLLALLGKDRAAQLHVLSGIDFHRRGESLEEAEFIRLAELVAAL